VKQKDNNKFDFEKQKKEFIKEEEEEESQDNYDNALNDEVKTNENVDKNISASDFDPEQVLYAIRKALLGYDKRDNEWVRVSYPLARTEFITLYINSIRALVNFHNMFSQISGDESAFNMLEGLKEITFAAVDYGVEEEHIETLINIYDTLKQTFYGIIIEGRGTENVKQVLISAYKDISALNMPQQQTGIINLEAIKQYIK